MKLNISCPSTGCQKPIAIDDDKKLSIFYGKRMGHEVEGDILGDECKGYVFKITGGNDKDGFSMKQGVLVQGRVRLLMAAGSKCYRPRRAGERKRKSVRGCIVGPDLSVIALAIVKIGEQPIAGLTDTKLPKRLGPKRATRIRKLFALTKDDDVRRFVIRRKIEKEGKPVRYKAPKIQRLVTDERLRRKRVYKAGKKARWERTRKAVADYQKVLEEYRKKKAQEHKDELAANKARRDSKNATPVVSATLKKGTTAAPAGKTAAAGKTATGEAAATTTAAAGKAGAKGAAPVQAAGKAGAKGAAPTQAAGKQQAAPAKAETKQAPAKTQAAPAKTETKQAAPAKKEAPKKK